MTDHGHHALVVAQFESQAAAYVASAVHAQGEDLDALADLVRGRSEARVLDLGCGGGHVSFAVAPHVRSVVACDLSPGMLAAVEQAARERGLENVETVLGPAERLPFDDGAFDYVLTRFSAHHWHDLAAGLREARRVLRADGRAAFVDVIAPASAPLDTFLQTVELLRDPSHVRDYALREWTTSLQEAGFRVIRTTPRRLRLAFGPWIERMRTPPLHVAAVRSLEALAPHESVRHFELAEDGSFTIDTATIEAVPA